MKLWCYLIIMINVQGVEIFIRKNYFIKIIQGWIRFMSEYNLYEVFGIIFFSAMMGFGLGYAIASYQANRILHKIEDNYKEIKKEFDL